MDYSGLDEAVVYEDSPLAEYFASIEAEEISVPVVTTTATDSFRWPTILTYWPSRISNGLREALSLGEDLRLSTLLYSHLLSNPLIDARPPKRGSRPPPLFPPSASWLDRIIGRGIIIPFGSHPWIILSQILLGVGGGAAGMLTLFLRSRPSMSPLALRGGILAAAISWAFMAPTRRLLTLGASRLAAASHRLHVQCAQSILGIGEVELVSRGYRLAGRGGPLGGSPIARLESPDARKHCLPLRLAIIAVVDTSMEGVREEGRSETHYEAESALGLGSEVETTTPDDMTIRGLQHSLVQLHCERRLALADQLGRLEMVEGEDLSSLSLIRAYRYGWSVGEWMLQLARVEEKGAEAVRHAFQAEFASFRSWDMEKKEKEEKEEDRNIDLADVAPGTASQWAQHVLAMERQIATIRANMYIEREAMVAEEQVREDGRARWASVRQTIEEMSAVWSKADAWLEERLAKQKGVLPEAGSELTAWEPAEMMEGGPEEEGQGRTFDTSTDNPTWDVPGAVYEAMADPVEFFRPASTLSREERIRIQKEKRSNKGARTTVEQDKGRWLMELKDVLQDRDQRIPPS